MTAHTPTPYKARRLNQHTCIETQDGIRIADVRKVSGPGRGDSEQDAAFIVRACNAHEELVAALQKVCREDGIDGRCYRIASAALAKAGAA